MSALFTTRMATAAVVAAWLACAAILARGRRRGVPAGALAAFAGLTAAESLAAAMGSPAEGGLRLALGAGGTLAAGAAALGLGARSAGPPAPPMEENPDLRWLRVLADRTEEGIVVTDARMRIQWVNAGFTRITGYEPDEALGRTPGALLHGPETDPAVRAYVARLLRAGKPARAELVNYARSGRSYWAAVEIRPLRDAGDRIVNFIAVQNDVTERKRAERRLEAQYAVMRILSDRDRLDEAIPHLLATIGRTLDFDLAAFWTWDRQTKAPKLVGKPWLSSRIEPWREAEVAIAPPPPPVAGPMERVLSTGAPAWVSEIAAPRGVGSDAPATDAPRGLRSVVVVPVADAERSLPVGVLTLFGREPMERDEPLIQVLTALGRQIGLFAERRKALREQAEMNARLNAMLDASTQSAIVATDPGGLITIFNTGAERMLGYSAAEMVGRSTPLVLHDPDEIAARAREATAESGRPVQGFEALVGRARRDGHDVSEWSYVRKDGARIAVLLAVTAVREPEGTLRGFLAIATDLSQRQAAERKLRESEGRLRRLVEANIFGVAFGELTGALTDANDAFLDMLGHSRDDLIDGGIHWLSLTVDPGSRRVRRRRVQLLRHGSCPPFETEIRRKDGRVIPVLMGLARLDDSRADARAPIVAFCLDLTERKVLEDELRRHASDLAEADHRKNQFIAMLGHELRNPLAAIVYAARVLKRRDEDAATIDRTLDAIDHQAAQLAHLVDDLLEIARIDRDMIALKPEPTDVAAVIALATETARPEIEARGHSLTVVAPPSRLIVSADPARMAQVLSNLLHNAAKYTENGGSIRISAAAEGEFVAFRVRDDGIGIPPAMLSRVFEVFTQVERTLDRSQGGLGLGLSLVRRLTEMHGGTAEAFSEGPGRGSEFVVRLPLSRIADDEPPNEPIAAAAAPAPSPPRRILVVDDNVGAAESLTLILRHEGHTARLTHDGPSALRAVEEERFDVVLMDIGLPGMTGYEVARRLRARPDAAGLRLIAVTGYAEDEARRLSREAGFDHHMVKPVDPDAILAAVAASG